MARKRLIVPIFISHQGCPYRCVFCDQGSITGNWQRQDHERIETAFREYLSSALTGTMPPVREAAFYGGTFTGMPRDRQLFLLSRVQRWVERGWIQTIRLSTHSLYVDRERLALLREFSVRTVELGVQSTDDRVLKLSGREGARDLLEPAVAYIREVEFELGLQIMIGLPGDTDATFQATVDHICALRPDFVRIYPALVLRGTELHRMFQTGEYVPWELERVIEALCRALPKLEAAGIAVARIGLHPEASMLENLVAGPFHPSLRYLVECRRGLDRLVSLLSGRPKDTLKGNRVVIRVPSRQLSIYTGHRRENIEKLKNLFSLEEVVLKGGMHVCDLELAA